MHDKIRLANTLYHQDTLKTQKYTFNVGDTINVHVKIQEDDKERVQIFQGVVLGKKKEHSPEGTFIVRKISSGIAVERIFPFVSPNIAKIEVLREGKVRRAKLNYLKDKKGKSAKVKEKIKVVQKEKQEKI